MHYNTQDLYNGERGYSWDLLPNRIEAKHVTSRDQFDNNIDALTTHLRAILLRFATGLNRTVKFKVGKSSVLGKANQHFNVDNPQSWRKDGVKSRWGDYQNKGFHALVVFYVFAEFDVTQQFLDHRMDNQFVSLIYEHAMEKRCMEDDYLGPRHLSVDIGGGGRWGAEAEGFLLYVAVKAIDVLQCKCAPNTVKVSVACKICIAVVCEDHKDGSLDFCQGCESYTCTDHPVEYKECYNCKEKYCVECTDSGYLFECINTSCEKLFCEICLDEYCQECTVCQELGCTACIEPCMKAGCKNEICAKCQQETCCQCTLCSSCNASKRCGLCNKAICSKHGRNMKTCKCDTVVGKACAKKCKDCKEYLCGKACAKKCKDCKEYLCTDCFKSHGC